MKKLFKLALLVFVPLIVGFVLIFAGDGAVSRAGVLILEIGVPLTMVVLVGVGIVLMSMGKLSDDKKDDGITAGSERDSDVTFGRGAEDFAPDGADNDNTHKPEPETAMERERQKIEEINSSYGYDSQMKLAQYQMEQSSKIYNSTGKGGKILGFLLLGFLLTDFAMIIVFGYLGIKIGMFVCFGLFGGTILLFAIITAVQHKISMSDRVNPKKYVQTTGTVIACTMSSMTSTGGGNRGSSVRVNSVIYRVALIADGKEFTAYSRRAFDEGEKIEVMVKKNGKGLARIIGD